MDHPTIDQTFNIIDLLNLAIGLAIVVAVALSIYYMFSGGISLILSGGNDDKIKESVNTIRYSVIGLVVTILAVVFIYLLGNVFNVQVSEYINFQRIYGILFRVFNRIINGPNFSGDSELGE